MRSTAWLLAALCLLGWACASAPPRGSLGERVDAVIEQSAGAGGRTVAIAFHDLQTGEELMRAEHASLHAASTMKVPVMVALWAAIDRGELSLDQAVPVRNEFKSIADGSSYTLDAKEDGDPDLYAALGGTRPLGELMRRMIVRSSNLATNLLIELAGAPRVGETMRALGAGEMRVLRGVEDGKAYEKGLNNTVTAYDLLLVLRAIAEGRAVSAAASAHMIEILSRQEFNEKIPAGLPPGVRVAHKTGDITGIHHDSAIVWPAPDKPPYLLVVLTSGYADEAEANRTIAAISQAIWELRRGAG
jgi:beta-lactamase class A